MVMSTVLSPYSSVILKALDFGRNDGNDGENFYHFDIHTKGLYISKTTQITQKMTDTMIWNISWFMM